MSRPDDDPRDYLPLHPLEFRILLALQDQARHGYAIVKDVEARAGEARKIFPANLYRRIRSLRASGLVADADPPAGEEPDDQRERRYFRLTRMGREVAVAEARRLRELLGEADSLLAAEGDGP